MFEALGIDAIFAQLTVALGLALLAGNGFALWKHRRGERPAGADGEFRAGRVWFLLIVGAVMSVWGLVSL